MRLSPRVTSRLWSVFFFNDTATTEIYTLSLHDALPISNPRNRSSSGLWPRSSARLCTSSGSAWMSNNSSTASRRRRTAPLAVQLALARPLLHQIPGGVVLLLVLVVLHVRDHREIVADVFVAIRAHGAHTVDGCIHAVPRGEDVRPGLVRGPEDVLALHRPGRRANAGEPEQRGREVDAAHQPLIHRARRPVVGETHDQRDAHPAVVQELLAAEQRAVVARQHHHRVASQALVLQALQ